MDTIRAFIAVELPPHIKSELARAQQDLQSAAPGIAQAVKWVDPASSHLTLKFLGDTPIARLDPIISAMRRVAATSSVLTLTLDRAGCFPNERQPRVLWVGVSRDTEALALLQTAVEEAISPLGFPRESRRFSPHLTLGRVRDEATVEQRSVLGRAMRNLRIQSLDFTISELVLIRSDLSRSGPIYTPLARAVMGIQS